MQVHSDEVSNGFDCDYEFEVEVGLMLYHQLAVMVLHGVAVLDNPVRTHLQERILQLLEQVVD